MIWYLATQFLLAFAGLFGCLIFAALMPEDYAVPAFGVSFAFLMSILVYRILLR